MTAAGFGQQAALDAVRAAMLGTGYTREEVAGELQRRFGLRPREALRHAHGWTQNEAGVQFAHVAARSGGRPAGQGAPAAEAGSHIGEYERWPAGGRQPSLYVLVVLAAVYGTEVQRLLDADDWRALPVRDRVVVTALAGGDEPPRRRRKSAASSDPAWGCVATAR